MLPITAGEIWYLRLILLNRPITSYEDALDGCRTFQLAATSVGCVNDKEEAVVCFTEAITYSTPRQLRALFILNPFYI